MANKRLKKIILEVVNNQLDANDPPYVGQAYEELLDLGYSRNDAKEKIAAVVVEEIYDIMNENQPFNDERYRQNIARMLQNEYDMEGPIDPGEDIWYGFEELQDQAREAMDLEEGAAKALPYWEKTWDIIKRNVEEAETKPELFEVDEATDYAYGIEQWLMEMAYAYIQAGQTEKCIDFCREVMAVFTWEQESPVVFEGAIGSALLEADRIEEADQWMMQWQQKNENDDEVLLNCASYWQSRGDAAKAKKLLETCIDENEECDFENHLKFTTACMIYKALGENEKAGALQEKVIDFNKKMEEDPYAHFGPEELNFLGEEDGWDVMQPLVKEKKVYPNDPCPCGSGKKYKKCCGRK